MSVTAAIRIRVPYTKSRTLSARIERIGDSPAGSRVFWDFTNHVFSAAPASDLLSLTENSVAGRESGYYVADYDTSSYSAQFNVPDYVITVHDAGASQQVVYLIPYTLRSGDDLSLYPVKAGADGKLDAAAVDAIKPDGTNNLRQAVELILSVLMFKGSGATAGGGTYVARDLADARDVATIVGDQYGNRSSVTLNPNP